MKFKFDSKQQYQLDAIDAVVDLFEGQPAETGRLTEALRGNLGFESNQPELDINAGQQSELAFEIGAVSNNLVLDDETILQNLRRVQERNGLMPSETLVDGRQFDVEMETGTGKTYVYLRTIFELAARYGFTKFVILVPSVAIREGVNTSIELMRSHFNDLYPTLPFDHYVYSGDDAEQVQAFSTSTAVQIMVMTVASIKGDKNTRIFHQQRDKLGGLTPAEYLRAARPFVIMDEPQNMESELSASAIGDLNPTAMLRYSATHRTRRNLVYQLDPVDAHRLELVKQIVVAEVTQQGANTAPYVKLIEVKPNLTAKLELEVRDKNGVVSRKKRTVKTNADLEKITDNQAYANNWRLAGVSLDPPSVELSNHPQLLVGEEIGGSNHAIFQDMIRETIREHLRREKELRPKGIKVLSLFFVDKVESYLGSGVNNDTANGDFTRWFDEIYKDELRRDEAYKALLPEDPHEVRSAYFAQMKNGTMKDSKSGDTENDSRAYDLIMKDKARLLSLDEPVRFIFSHSALREGWDNPNVFQICSLREMGGDTERRQTLGRGLRLPVDQQGNRYRERDIAQLTVVANESYANYAKGLQEDYVRAGVEIGRVRPQEFAKLIHPQTDQPLGGFESEGIHLLLQKNGYLDADGHITELFKPDHEGFSLHLGEELEELEPQIIDIMREVSIGSIIKPIRRRRTRKLNKQVYLDPEFEEMWNRISQRTTYSVSFDREKLVKDAIAALDSMPPIEPLRVQVTRNRVQVRRGGLTSQERGSRSTELSNFDLPDVVSELQGATSLTRRTIVDILVGTERLEDFTKNPNDFIALARDRIQLVMSRVVQDGLEYEPIEGSVYSIHELRRDGEQEKQFFLDTMYKLENAEKSDFDYVVTDSEVEKRFAAYLDHREDVRLFTKLPPKFQVPTPVGPYNPDWAIIKREGGEDKLFLIRETKGTVDSEKLREAEAAKIAAARKHFAVLDIDYDVASPEHWNIAQP